MSNNEKHLPYIESGSLSRKDDVGPEGTQPIDLNMIKQQQEAYEKQIRKSLTDPEKNREHAVRGDERLGILSHSIITGGLAAMVRRMDLVQIRKAVYRGVKKEKGKVDLTVQMEFTAPIGDVKMTKEHEELMDKELKFLVEVLNIRVKTGLPALLIL